MDAQLDLIEVNYKYEIIEVSCELCRSCRRLFGCCCELCQSCRRLFQCCSRLCQYCRWLVGCGCELCQCCRRLFQYYCELCQCCPIGCLSAAVGCVSTAVGCFSATAQLTNLCVQGGRTGGACWTRPFLRAIQELRQHVVLGVRNGVLCDVSICCIYMLYLQGLHKTRVVYTIYINHGLIKITHNSFSKATIARSNHLN